jgi:hypothetical protein
LQDWILSNKPGKATTIPLDFSSSGLPEDKYEVLLGFTKANFEILLKFCSPYMRNTTTRSVRSALALFLMKLRLDIPQNVLAVLFGIDHQSTVSSIIDSVSSVLDKEFAPFSLGFDKMPDGTYMNMSREEAISKHNRKLFHELFNVPDDKLFFIIDGTYLYIQKPGNYDEQKLTWSVHKKRNLVKPMMICLSSGHVIAVPGPYYTNGRNNDASILNSLLKPGKALEEFVQEGDCFILDRGFRDSKKVVEDLGIIFQMPQLLKEGKKSFSTKEANDSRIVTMTRWIIEVVNGRLKLKFKFFRNVIAGSYAQKIPRFFRVAMAIINRFCPPIFTESEFHQMIAQRALHRKLLSNDLRTLIQRHRMDTNMIGWTEVSLQHFDTFPRLTEDDLKTFTMGIYQINTGRRYFDRRNHPGEHFRLFENPEHSLLVRAKILSRHINTIKYNVWIQFKNDNQGLESILGYVCSCQVGARTVGACSHTTSVSRIFCSFQFM